MIDWTNAEPKDVTRENLLAAKDEDFPQEYGAAAWQCAARILQVLRDDVEAIRTLDSWSLDARAAEAIHGLDLTGFMVGWACGVLRQMHGATPGKSGAVIEIGTGVVDQPTLAGNAEAELRVALGGSEAP